MGSIFFGIALSLQALTGYPMSTIMIVVGICIVLYTVMGGMEAVIWTEVVQGVIKTIGALVILYLVVAGVSGGMPSIIEIGKTNDKFSLGTLAPDFTQASFWVILFYGFFMNLNNFGMDQNYVQRYHTTSSAKEAAGSVWLCVYLYVPVSLIFFLLGTCLFAYYQGNPELLQTIKMQVAAEKLPGGTADAVANLAATLTPADYGDKVMPHFMVNKVPVGLLGLIIAAIMSAAMSTISSGMNASATVFSVDIYQKYIKSDLTPRQSLRLLYVATTVFGVLGMVTGIAMIGVKSVLDVWWMLSGIFAGGMLGLFLLGIISKSTKNTEALTATIIGIVVIIWMTFSTQLPDSYSHLRNPLHQNMIMVVGTLTIFLAGVLLTRLRRKEPVEKDVLLHSK
jgi:SSS family solute:Na+ symporter